jgi:hypothetical protein
MRKEYAISLAVVGVIACAAVIAVQSFTPSSTQLQSNALGLEDIFLRFISAHKR